MTPGALEGLHTVEVVGPAGPQRDLLAVEEPLEIRIDEAPVAVLMRTPGHDLDLVAGFLLTEGLIDDLDDVAGMAHCADPRRAHRHNLVKVRLQPDIPDAAERLAHVRRTLHASASCGVCGKVALEQVFQKTSPLPPTPPPPPAQVVGLPERLRSAQPLFERTGGLHGAALMSADGEVVYAREDIGRHNAVDKVIGARMRCGAVSGPGTSLVVSSRAGFEIIQKSLMARIGIVVAVGAASSLADQLARASGIHLYSWARDGRANYHPPSRQRRP